MRERPYSDPSPSDPQSCRVTVDDVTRVIDLETLFPRKNPVEIDVGCGKGRFLRSRSESHPNTNFLGVDRMGSRLGKLERKIRRGGLDNVRLVQMEAAYVVEHLLPPASVAGFYIFFPDPWPKRKHHRRRLLNPGFLDALSKALVPGGRVNFATDHLEYFDQAFKLLKADNRFDQIETFEPTEQEKTDFELIFVGQGMPIGRCSFATRIPA